MARLFGMIITGLATATAVAEPLAAADVAPKAVIELFTSQGCSSCPPADALFEKLSGDRSILTLSYPVDYWDYLGWKDTFARSDFTARQRAYAAQRGDRAVYTPQAVVNGRAHVVGSDETGIKSLVSTQAHNGGLPVAVRLETTGDSVTAHIGPSPASGEAKATVWLVKFSKSETVSIARGENTGHSVTYAHVVRDMQPIGMWKGQDLSLELPREALASNSRLGFAILLQTEARGAPGPIIGAALIDPSSPL